MLHVFIERLRALSDPDRKLLAAAGAAAAGTVVVRSAYDLPAQQRGAIEQAVTEICGAAARPSYQTVPGLISGVELSANGRKLAWSIADYLGALQKSVGDSVAAPVTPSPPAAPAAPVAPAAAQGAGR